jgi:hypothetical protein
MAGRESLRDIEECGNAKGSAALCHSRLRERVARATFAETNEQRDWRLRQDLATRLTKRARRLYAGEDLDWELDQTIYWPPRSSTAADRSDATIIWPFRHGTVARIAPDNAGVNGWTQTEIVRANQATHLKVSRLSSSSRRPHLRRCGVGSAQWPLHVIGSRLLGRAKDDRIRHDRRTLRTRGPAHTP